MPLQPRHRVVDDFVGAPGDVAERDRPVLRDVELVDVGVESLVEAPLRIEHERADERAGAVIPRPSALGERHVPGIEDVAAVVTHAVEGRRRPVKSVECAGSVSGADVTACSKRTPSWASRSRFGVSALRSPYAPIRSARVVSSVMTQIQVTRRGAATRRFSRHPAATKQQASTADTRCTQTGRPGSTSYFSFASASRAGLNGVGLERELVPAFRLRACLRSCRDEAEIMCAGATW